jgi:hypothetical protein
MISFNSISKDCHTGFVVYCNLIFYLVVLNSVSFMVVTGQSTTSSVSTALRSIKSKVDRTSSQRSGGRRVVRCEIIVGALALTISLVFEIFAEKLKSTATPFHNPPAATELLSILPKINFR